MISKKPRSAPDRRHLNNRDKYEETRRGLREKKWIAPVAVFCIVAFSLLPVAPANGMPVVIAYGIWAACGQHTSCRPTVCLTYRKRSFVKRRTCHAFHVPHGAGGNRR